MFYTVLTARVIFTVKTSLGVFSLTGEHILTWSVLGDRICEMKRVYFFVVVVKEKSMVAIA